MRGGKIDAKPGQEFHTSRRYFPGFVAKHDEIMRHHRVGKIDTERAGNVVVASAGAAHLIVGF
jgi:hypothetical protein